MSFIDSYKRLEKLCSEMYGDNHGVSAYIDDMKAKSNGYYYVPGWDEDLKQLKHYRMVRNKIVHEPGYSEKNLCESGDAKWLDNFYNRIMSGKDPLALYRKATASRALQKRAKTTSRKPASYKRTHHKKASSKTVGCFTLILALIIVAIIVFAENIVDIIYAVRHAIGK